MSSSHTALSNEYIQLIL